MITNSERKAAFNAIRYAISVANERERRKRMNKVNTAKLVKALNTKNKAAKLLVKTAYGPKSGISPVSRMRRNSFRALVSRGRISPKRPNLRRSVLLAAQAERELKNALKKREEATAHLKNAQRMAKKSREALTGR
jgi:hypothetical protein